APFPPTLRLNFGQEKLDPHVTLWGQTDHDELGLDRAPSPSWPMSSTGRGSRRSGAKNWWNW
ncbi:MAG: hypothetical protein R6X34_10355, partial [Chloroflexota bacterium]